MRQLYSTNIKKELSHIFWTGRSFIFLSSASMMGVQMGETSELGRLIGWDTRHMWADSLYFLYVVFSSICKTFASYQHILFGLLHIRLIFIFASDISSDFNCSPQCMLINIFLFRRCNICHNHMEYCTPIVSPAGHLWPLHLSSMSHGVPVQLSLLEQPVRDILFSPTSKGCLIQLCFAI
jgi:hypothetical protein